MKPKKTLTLPKYSIEGRLHLQLTLLYNQQKMCIDGCINESRIHVKTMLMKFDKTQRKKEKAPTITSYTLL
jgi:hypothetical protein